MTASTLQMIINGNAKKGDVLGIARLAGIMGAKHTGNLIPLCHPIRLDHVNLDLEPDSNLPGIQITATCKVVGATGVEMEALSAVSVAGLTVYDMCKAASKEIKISDIILESKSGGETDYVRPAC